jgi:hypothetical protein
LKAPVPGDARATAEPGLDLHEWQTEWEALEPLVEDSPREALPEFDTRVVELDLWELANVNTPADLEALG